MSACTTPQATGTKTAMRATFLVLLLWAVACAHPVPGREPARLRRSTQQEDTASEDYLNKLGNLLGGGDGRHPPVSAERGDNALARDLAGGNAVGEELGEHGGREKGDRVGDTQRLNWVDHKDTSAQDGNSLGFLEEDARDADDGDNREHHGTGVNGLPSHAGRLLDEEDDSGDDTFDVNGEEEGSEGPTYMAGADGAGEHNHDAGRGDAGAGRGHGDSSSSSSSSSESTGADHWQYRNYLSSRYERTYRQGGGSSSSQEEESYDFEDEAMQGDDPSIFDGPGSSYKGRRAGPHALGSSRESGWGAGSHRWEDGDSRSPEVEDTDSGEDSLSTEDNSQSEEPVTSQSEEKSASRSEEDSPSMEDDGSKSREGTAEQSDEEPGESPEDISQEVVSTSSKRSGSRSQEGQEDRESAEDRSAPSAPDSESGEDEGDQSQSAEDTVEQSKEDENDSDPDGDMPSTSAESQSASPEDDSSQEDNVGEDSRSTESNNSESQEDDDDDDKDESHSQEDATRESSSHGDDSSLQSLESRSRKRRPGAYHNKPAAEYDDNDCQDGY